MAVFLKLFIIILSMSALLMIVFPDDTQLLQNNLFNEFLKEGGTNETITSIENLSYSDSDLNPENDPAWSEGGQGENSLLSKFLDGLSIIKKLINTIINLATVPIALALNTGIPIVIRILFFWPLTILYYISAAGLWIRGVNP